MRGTYRAVTFVAAMSLGGVTLALAQTSSAPATARLSWVRAAGAESCADRATLEADVDKRLGRDAFGGTPSRSIEGIISRAPKGWIAHLYIRDAGGALLGEREIESDAEGCTSLSNAVGLAVALAIDPEAALLPPPSSSSSSSAPPAISVSGRTSSSAIVEPIEPPKPLPLAPLVLHSDRAAFVARGGVVSGLAPRAAPIVAIEVEPMRDWFVRPRIGAMLVPNTRTADGAFGFGVTAARIAGCHDLAGDDAIALTLCLGALIGVVHAVVYDLEPVTPGDRAWGAVSSAIDARLRIVGPLSVIAGFDATWPLVRHRFIVEGKGTEVFQQPFVALIGTLGLALRL